MGLLPLKINHKRENSLRISGRLLAELVLRRKCASSFRLCCFLGGSYCTLVEMEILVWKSQPELAGSTQRLFVELSRYLFFAISPKECAMVLPRIMCGQRTPGLTFPGEVLFL